MALYESPGRGAGYRNVVLSVPESVNTRNGKALIELVVTIAVIGIVATVAMPSSQPQRYQELVAGSSTTADAIRFSREQARLTGELYGAIFDRIAQQAGVFRIDSGSGVAHLAAE